MSMLSEEGAREGRGRTLHCEAMQKRGVPRVARKGSHPSYSP